MATFFIVPFEYDEEFTGEILPQVRPSKLIIDVEYYKQKLIQDWRGIRFEPPNIIHVLIWLIETHNSRMLKGQYSLQNDYQTLAMDGSDREFTLWHRSVIPQEYRLFLTGENTSKAVELKLDTTSDDLDKVFS